VGETYGDGGPRFTAASDTPGFLPPAEVAQHRQISSQSVLDRL
jgi:hypothetical protein